MDDGSDVRRLLRGLRIPRLSRAREVYRCWRDLGDAEMVVGSIVDERNWDVLRIADYMTGTSCYDHPECRECFFLPVCGGGCANHRLRRQLFGEDCDPCVTFKDRLPEYLEIVYEKSREGHRARAELGDPTRRYQTDVQVYVYPLWQDPPPDSSV